ncbi:MAG: transposase [Sphingomonas echinoides]|jgi:transposase
MEVSSDNRTIDYRCRGRNPIEQMFSELKARLRKADERSVDATWKRIGSPRDQPLSS